MDPQWCSPAHNWCLIEAKLEGEGAGVEIWRGNSRKCESQKYLLDFFTGARPEQRDSELLEKAMRLAMGEFNERTAFGEAPVRLSDDGSINPWAGELPKLLT